MILFGLLLSGKLGRFRLLSAWNWFVIVSELIVILGVVGFVWFGTNHSAIKVIGEVLAGLLYVFILREIGTLGWIKKELFSNPKSGPANDSTTTKNDSVLAK